MSQHIWKIFGWDLAAKVNKIGIGTGVIRPMYGGMIFFITDEDNGQLVLRCNLPGCP